MTEQSGPAGAVFLSYASQDADAAARICEALRAASVEVWFDRSELRGGDAWDSQIKKHIHDCALFIPIISAHTNARTEGYFRREWKLATRRLLDIADDAAFLVPVVIDETHDADARVPEEFLHVQWTRLPGGETPPAFAQRVRQLLGLDPAPVRTAKATATGVMERSASTPGSLQPSSTPLVRRFAIPLIMLLLVLSGGAFWYFQSVSNAPAVTPTTTAASSVVAAEPDAKSIAVLPLVNISSDKEQEYFSDGLSEELLNLLAKIPELRVAARTSSFYFKGKDVKLQDVARELQVAYLLEGSVRKAGNRVRITTQLIRASDGYHQWSETYDRTLDDIFAVQEEIAASVVSQLKVTLLGAPPKVRKTDPDAYALYLQAVQIDRQNANRFEESIALYKQVLAIDPNYAPAWLGLAYNYLNEAYYGFRPAEEGMKLSRQMTRKALAIEPEYALAHASLGLLAVVYDQDLQAAAQHFEHALILDPTNVEILGTASNLSQALGRLETDVELAEYLVHRDPMDPWNHRNLGVAFLYAGRLDDAIASSRAALKLSPEMAGAHGQIGVSFLLKGDHEAAIKAFQSEPGEALRLAGQAAANHALGHKEESDAMLDKLIKKYGKSEAMTVASVFAYRNEIDRSFEWIDKAVNNRDGGLAFIAKDFTLKNLHDDPRWLPLLRKLGKAPEQLAAIKFELKVPQH
jgi:TolB-like protein